MTHNMENQMNKKMDNGMRHEAYKGVITYLWLARKERMNPFCSDGCQKTLPFVEP